MLMDRSDIAMWICRGQVAPSGWTFVVSMVTAEERVFPAVLDDLGNEWLRISCVVEVNGERLAMTTQVSGASADEESGLAEWDFDIVFPGPSRESGVRFWMRWPVHDIDVAAEWAPEQLARARKLSGEIPVLGPCSGPHGPCASGRRP